MLRILRPAFSFPSFSRCSCSPLLISPNFYRIPISSFSTRPNSNSNPSAAEPASAESQSKKKAQSWRSIGAELRAGGYDFVNRDPLEAIDDGEKSDAEESFHEEFSSDQTFPASDEKTRNYSKSEPSTAVATKKKRFGPEFTFDAAAAAEKKNQKKSVRPNSRKTKMELELESIAKADLSAVVETEFVEPPEYGKLIGGESLMRSQLLEFSDSDIAESFSRGGGKGGQAVNTTSNCVHIRHLPTGTTVKCHATRSLDENRKIARKILKERLEELALGPESSRQLKGAKIRKQKDRRRRRRLKKLEEQGLGGKSNEGKENDKEIEFEEENDEVGEAAEEETGEKTRKKIKLTGKKSTPPMKSNDDKPSIPTRADRIKPLGDAAESSVSVAESSAPRYSKRDLLKRVAAQRQLLSILDDPTQANNSDEQNLLRLKEIQLEQEKEKKRKSNSNRIMAAKKK